MTTDLFKGIYITMRIYRTLIQTKSIPWNSSHETLNALKWALYCSEGYEHVRQTRYCDEFLEHTQRIREYISSTDIPLDFLPNAYGYMLHALFCQVDHQVQHREIALRIFSSNTTLTNQSNYSHLLAHLRVSVNPQRAFSHAHRCLLEALVTITLCLPKHFDFLFDLLHDLNQYDQLCSLIIETIFRRCDLSRSYDCLVSMKMEKLLDVLHQASYGAYVIVKLLAKNRASFVKGVQNSLAWHTNVFGKFSLVFATATYDPIRTVLIDICQDNEIRNVLMAELF